MRKIGLACAAVLVLAPSPASGQVFTEALYHNYCTIGGPLSACASATIRLERSLDTSFWLQIRVRNMQGSLWGYDNTGGYALGLNYVRVPTGHREGVPWWDPIAGLGRSFDGPVRVIADGAYVDTGHPQGATRDTIYHEWGPLPGTFYGCDAPSEPAAPFWGLYSMCSRNEDESGWHLYEIGGHYSTEFTASDVNFFWNTPGGQCNPTNSDESDCIQVATASVPEPSGAPLLATGVLGLLLVGLRHGRRKHAV